MCGNSKLSFMTILPTLCACENVVWWIQDFLDGGTYYYRPQRSRGKVIFSQASVILSTGRGMCRGGVHGQGACMVGGMYGGMHGGHAWGVCVVGGMCGQGECMAGWACMAGGVCVARGMHGSGHAWWGVCGQGGGMHGWGVCVHGWGCVWPGACMAGGYVWLGACMAGGMHGRGCAWQGGMVMGACMAGGMHDMHSPQADTTAMAYGQ